MSNRTIVLALAIGVIIISALSAIALVNPTPRLVELKGCEGPVFVKPAEVAEVFQDRSKYEVQTDVTLRANSRSIPICEKASLVAEKLGRVRRLED